MDYHYHENPELKRQPFVFLTDFVGCLPMEEGNEREAFLCADRNADDIEHVARYPWIRDRAIFVGNPEDAPDLPFGPGLPNIRDWTKRNFAFTGYALPFDPRRWPTRTHCARATATAPTRSWSSPRSAARRSVRRCCSASPTPSRR